MLSDCALCGGIRRALETVTSLSNALNTLSVISAMKRADERTRTADLLQLRVIGQALQGYARDCKSRIFRGVSFPCFAACCAVLRSRWYQSGINGTSHPANTVAHVLFFGVQIGKLSLMPLTGELLPRRSLGSLVNRTKVILTSTSPTSLYHNGFVYPRLP